MTELAETLARCAAWAQPRVVETNAFRLRCTIADPASTEEVTEAWHGRWLHPDVRELWQACRSAELFVDADYGQWGLRLLAPVDSAARSALELSDDRDFAIGDVVLGEFLGDQQLLVVDRGGGVLIALEMERRPIWPRPAPNLSEFLARYVDASGEKYWDPECRL
jgi:hypothetical protein